jgi:hypothetical protein
MLPQDDGRADFLSMSKPKEEPTDSAQSKSSGEKPARLRYCYQADQEHTEHDNQPDRVPR